MSAKSSTLSHRGWDRWDLGAEFGIDETGADFQALRTVYDDLPEDPYALGSGRFRRYAHGIFLPWSKEFFWMPATESQSHEAMYGYYQGHNNPEFVNITRNLRQSAKRPATTKSCWTSSSSTSRRPAGARTTQSGRCTSACT